MKISLNVFQNMLLWYYQHYLSYYLGVSDIQRLKIFVLQIKNLHQDLMSDSSIKPKRV